MKKKDPKTQLMTHRQNYSASKNPIVSCPIEKIIFLTYNIAWLSMAEHNIKNTTKEFLKFGNFPHSKEQWN